MEGVEVVGEAVDGIEALKSVETLQPDVLMTDIAMPGLDGLGLTTSVVKNFPRTHVLILSVHTEWIYADSALQAGAGGYLIKDSAVSEVELAIKAVARGERYLCPMVSTHLVTEYHRINEAKAAENGPLTLRQREVLKMIAEGKTTKAIAGQLHISTKTVETHRTQLMDRLDIHDIAGLVRYAIRHGIVNGDE